MPDKNKGTRKERRQLKRSQRANRESAQELMDSNYRSFRSSTDPLRYQYSNEPDYSTDEFGFEQYETLGEHARDIINKTDDVERFMPRKLSFNTPKKNPYGG